MQTYSRKCNTDEPDRLFTQSGRELAPTLDPHEEFNTSWRLEIGLYWLLSKTVEGSQWLRVIVRPSGTVPQDVRVSEIPRELRGL